MPKDATAPDSGARPDGDVPADVTEYPTADATEDRPAADPSGRSALNGADRGARLTT